MSATAKKQKEATLSGGGMKIIIPPLSSKPSQKPHNLKTAFPTFVFLIYAKQNYNHLKKTLISITYSLFFLLFPLSSTFYICFDLISIQIFPTQLQLWSWCFSIHRNRKERRITLSFVLLAASAQNKCTALVWSCYVPSKGYHNKGEENSKNDDNNDNSNSIISDKEQSVAERKDGVKEEVDNNEATGCDSSSSSNNGGRNSRSSGSNGPHIEHSNLKSNLKKAVVEENHQLRTERRKVSWPDAHGKDIAHVQEFEPSVSEDGELEGVRNSCVCVIQ